MPTLLTTERVKGRKVNLACGGNRSNWDKFDAEAMFEVENPQGADATFKQKILDVSDGKATITSYIGASNNQFTLPKKGQEVTDLEFSVDEESVVDEDMFDVLKSGKWRVLNVKVEGSKDSLKITLSLESGFID